MEKNNLIHGMIGIMICVVLLGGLLLPVVVSATDAEKTVYNNTASNKYSLLYDNDLDGINATIEVRDFSEGKIYVTMDGITEEVAVTNRDNMLMSDKGFVRIDASGQIVRLFLAGQTTYLTTASLPVKVTISNGVVNVKDSSTIDYTFTPEEWMFIPDNVGNYELVLNTATDIYVNSINDLYFATIIDTNELGFAWGSNGKATFYDTNLTFDMTFTTSEKVNPFVDLYRIDMANYQFSTDAGTNADGSGFCPYMVMVPVSVDAHTESNVVVTALLNVLPIITIISIVAAGIYLFMGRKY